MSADLAACDVAVVAGGVTLYEACAVGVPVVALAVVAAQRPAIADFAVRGAAIDAGALMDPSRSGGAGRRPVARRLACTPTALVVGGTSSMGRVPAGSRRTPRARAETARHKGASVSEPRAIVF